MISAAIASVILACTPPEVAADTIRTVVQVESGGDPLALNINRPNQEPLHIHPANVADALVAIQDAITAGMTVDIGLTQVNTQTAAKAGVNFATLLDPCENIRVGARLLQDAYAAALGHAEPGQAALQAALSAYNTGTFTQGFHNGYVAKYYPGSTPSPGPDIYGANPVIIHKETDDGAKTHWLSAD